MSRFIQFLIVCPLVFLAGFVDSIAGGGGLISLPAYMFAGLPVHLAMGTNKLSSSLGSTISAIRYIKSGYVVRIKQIILSVIFGYIGSTLGARTALLTGDRFFKLFMLVVIPVVGFFVLRKNILAEKKPLDEGLTMIIAVAISFAVGFYDGFYGPGAGVFLIILFVAVAHLKLTEANGNAKVINMTTNIAAVIIFIINRQIDIPLAIVSGAFSVAGAYLGTKCFNKSGIKAVKPIMVAVLIIFFIKLIVELVQEMGF